VLLFKELPPFLYSGMAKHPGKMAIDISLFWGDYTDGHRVRTSKFFQNLVAQQLEPQKNAHLEPWFAKGSNSLELWFAKGSNSGGNTNQL